MGLREEIEWAISEVKKGKTDADRRSAARRVVAGWTSHYIQAVKEDLAHARGAAGLALKRAVNEKTKIRFFDLGER